MHRTVWLAAIVVLAAVNAGAQTPLGTSFTYQGQLRDGGSPATGSFDFQFGLYGVASGGTATGPSIDRPGVAVANGLFTVPLDFGAAAFAGDARWLEIRVKPAGGTLYTILGTRQPLTAAPYALSAAGVVDGSIVDSDVSATANLSGAKLANASVTGAKIAGGPGSGVHADTLDNLNATQLLRSDQNGTLNGTLTLDDSGGANATLGEAGFTRTATGVVSFAVQNGGAGPFDAAQVLVDASAGATAPAFSFVGDTDTGVSRSAVNQLDLVAGGTVIARATTTGLATPGDVVVGGDLDVSQTLRGFGFALGSTSPYIAPVTFHDISMHVPEDYAIYINGSGSGGSNEFTFAGFLGRVRLRVGNVGGEGAVGIGRQASTHALEVEGNASKTTAGSWLANSDRRLKTDVLDLADPLGVIRRLRPVSFRYNDDFLARHPQAKDVRYHNFIAQEFEEVFPDSVQDDGEGFLQMDSYPANIYAVGAIQELDRIVAEKDARISALEARLARLEALLEHGR